MWHFAPINPLRNNDPNSSSRKICRIHSIKIRMSVGDIGLIFTSILTLRQLYVDVEGNKKDCRNLISRCSALEKPLQAIQADKVRLLSSQEALSSLLSVLEDCVAFCKKYAGKRWLVKAYRNINGNDKDRFAELNARISASSTDLQLGINFDSMSGVSQGIVNLRHHLGDDMTEIKARVSELTNMVQDLLQSRTSTGLAEPLSAAMIVQAIRNSEELLAVSEHEDGDMSSNIDQELPVSEFSMSSAGISTSDSTISSLSASTKSCLSPYTQNGLLPIDHSQLVWHKEPANLLGAGAFGAVYKGEYLRVPCAIKHFACLAQQTPTARELNIIRREARILQLASFHPNIVGFRGADLNLGLLLMELATCSLHDVLYRPEKRASLPIDATSLPTLRTFAWKMHVLIDILSALSFLHFHSVLHRDIKSANILFVFDSSRLFSTGLPLVAKLSDFGLASAVGLSSSGLSASGSTGSSAVGTSAYMAPELLDFEHHPQYSPASDIYALGILANELLIEQAPWSGLRDIHVLNMVVNKRQRPAGYVTQDPLEQHVIKNVIGDPTTGALHQEAEARPTAGILSQYLQEYFSFLAEDINAIKPVPDKAVPLDRPALLKQVAVALFPTITDEELLEMIAADSHCEESAEVENAESAKEKKETTVLITQASESFSEEALSERLVDEFESDLQDEQVTSKFDLEGILSAPATPFAPYPEAPEILHQSTGSFCDDSSKSNLAPTSAKTVKPAKPVKPTSLKTTITPVSESSKDPVQITDSAVRDRVAALILTLTSASAAVSATAKADRMAALQELVQIAQQGSSQQTLVASLGGIHAVVSLLDQCRLTASTHSPCCSAEECVLIAQLVAFLAKNHPSNQSELARQGALPMLVHLLVHPTQEAIKESVVSALIYLIRNHIENQAALVELQGLSTLIAFVAQEHRRDLQGGAEALRLLTDMAISHHDFPSIVVVLQHGPEPLQVQMAQLLCVLTENNVANQNALSRTDAIPTLIVHLNNGSEELVEHSAKAMKSLATKHAVNREAIVATGGIEALTLVVVSGLGNARVTSMDLLRVICGHTPALRAQIATPELLHSLKAIQDNKVTANFVKHSADLLIKELTRPSGFAMPQFLANFAQGLGK